MQLRIVHLKSAQQHNTVSVYDVRSRHQGHSRAGTIRQACWAGQAADDEAAGRSHHTAEQLFSETSHNSTPRTIGCGTDCPLRRCYVLTSRGPVACELALGCMLTHCRPGLQPQRRMQSMT